MTGGVRVNAGRKADPNALKRDHEWLTLPAEGRDGDTPRWPLDGYENREAALWAEMWRKPQAVAWERFGLHYEVAFFVRRFVQAEKPSSSSNNATLVRQMMDSLGLTTGGLRTNKWELSADELAEARHAREPLPSNNSRRTGRIKKVASSE